MYDYMQCLLHITNIALYVLYIYSKQHKNITTCRGDFRLFCHYQCICVCVYIYIYMYTCICVGVYIHIYIYIYV